MYNNYMTKFVQKYKEKLKIGYLHNTDSYVCHMCHNDDSRFFYSIYFLDIDLFSQIMILLWQYLSQCLTWPLRPAATLSVQNVITRATTRNSKIVLFNAAIIPVHFLAAKALIELKKQYVQIDNKYISVYIVSRLALSYWVKHLNGSKTH